MNDTYKTYFDVAYYAEVRPLQDSVDPLLLPVSKKVYLSKFYTIPDETWDDIAILEFPEGTNFSVEPVKLAKDYFEKEGDEAYIAGFGLWWENGEETSGGSQFLRHTKVSLMEKCYGTLRICGGNKTHRAFYGDSGGPMLINRNNQWYQIGVSSGSGLWDYRTRVSSYCNFIEEVTKNEVKCVSIFLEITHETPAQFPPFYKGHATPAKIFDFLIPFYSYDFGNECTATVISKRYLLTSAFCVFQNGPTEYSKLPGFSNYEIASANFFPDFRSKNIKSKITEPVNIIAYLPLNYVWPWNHNLAVVEFPEGTDFGVEAITLAKDYVQVYLDTAIIATFGRYEIKKNMHIEGSPPNLQHSNASFSIHEGGLVRVFHPNIIQTEGSATLIEKNGKLYQIAVNFHHGTPDGSGTFIPTNCKFIEEVTKNEVKCESVAPKIVVPTSNASKIEFQMVFLINFLILFFCLSPL
uniref:Peptidase S1 domain-containing protein n=1 Tax=Panagrolaimus sp. ES5 TaxID=591445 RepID=A0AC34FY95_9BILA